MPSFNNNISFSRLFMVNIHNNVYVDHVFDSLVLGSLVCLNP